MTESEQEQITEWHYKNFVKLELSIDTIESLLRWRTEPHEVHRLVVAGCPEEVMLRILQPLDDPTILGARERIEEYSILT